MEDARGTRRANQDGLKPKLGESAQGRPFTTMGGAMLHLDSTTPGLPTPESPHRRRNRQPPATAGAVLKRQFEAAEGEFDVKKFLLNQKGTQPFHKSSLFRASNFAKQVASMELPEVDSFQHSKHAKVKKAGVLPRMELGVSKSTGVLPGALNSLGSSHKSRRASGTGEHNQQSDEVDNPAISHFYSIEKMAESCFHATQNKNKTWLFLPGSDERSKGSDGTSSIRGNSITGVERPSRRVDVLDLDRCFDTAIQFATKKKHLDVACDEKLSMIDRDFMAIHARILQRYSSASEKSTEAHNLLTKLLFEQKWSDVVIGELESMLTVSFLEQGVILRKSRILYAKAFFQLEHLYRNQWRELMQENEDLEQLREEVKRMSELHKQDAQGMKEHYEAEIEKLTASFESVKGDMERRVTDSKEQMTKMGDTMKALNAIFRQMRDDTEKVKAVELRENYIKLEQKYEQCREEVEQLRPLVHEKQQLLHKIEELNRERDACNDQIAGLNNLVSSKDNMIASLMEQHSDLIAEQELRAARDEELRRQAQQEEEDEREDSPYAKGESSSPSNGRRRTSVSSTAVCVRCKQDLRVMSANGGLTEGDKGSSGERNNSIIVTEEEGFKLPARKKRIQCLYFRILLPNLGGRRPQREAAWTFSCMRSIMFAKQMDDSMCKRTGGVFPLRIRMPEYVYAWFSPWRSMKEEKAIAEEGEIDTGADAESGTDPSDPNSVTTAEHRQMQADEDRWCLYYGVRSLVQQGYLEAKLFLSLLDEKFGEDEQVFMLHCYRVLDVLLAGRLNWGPLREKVSYEMFAREYDTLFGRSPMNPDHPLSPPVQHVAPPVSTPRVPKTIWISPYHASLATSVILSKATEAERAALDKKILEYVVTNVPEEERPDICLEPKLSDEPEPVHKKKRSKLDRRNKSKIGDDMVDGDTPSAPQFVDANLWVELMMLEYKEEQAHRRAAIRLMFQTATTSAAASASESAANMSLSAMLGINYTSMDMEQFRVMVRTLNDEIPSFWVATLFRNAYMRGNGTVNFDSFMDAAETWQFFSTCMRLESPSSVIARLLANPLSRTPAVLSPSSQAAFVVDRLFTFVGDELRTTIKALPIWTRNMTDALEYDISSSMQEGSFSDGVRMLTSFQRLIDSLGVVKLVRRETTGSMLTSKDLFSIEKALQGLLDFARHRDKSTVELLIDAVKQKLCVKRVQMTFRKRLEQDNGAPLVLRSLMHRRYGSDHLDYNRRRAERPVIWLRLIISSILRHSMQSMRMSSLLMELSSVSSAFHAGRLSPLQLSVSSSLNGGIGPTPKPIFVELIYDYFLEKFGTRCETERVIHDVFSNCRSLVRTDSLALLFSYLCCMGNSCPEDRLLGQNEAVAFFHAVFRCGLHSFRLINPVPTYPTDVDSAAPDSPQENAESTTQIASSVAGQTDFVPIDVAETILQTAFAKLSADQKMRLRLRIIEAASSEKSVGPPSEIEANAFLVLALHEWRRYILHRLNEIRVTCCAVEEELTQFEELLPLETLAGILQKTGIAYTSEDLCIISRRLYITEKAPTKCNEGGDTSSAAPTTDPMSDRIAAACFPLVAKEALNELQALEHASPKPFEISPSPLQSYEILVSTWDDYQEPCRNLLEELRETGKNNDIQAKALSRWPGTHSAGKNSGGDVLYLSSSSSANTVSSQDVAQLEAVHALFLDKLQRLTEMFDNSTREKERSSAGSTSTGRRRSSINIKRDGSLQLVDEVIAQDIMVHETWKVFRQMFVGFVKLRAIARIGKGALPDQWEVSRN